MINSIVPSHVALLVPSVRKAADYLARFDFQIGEEEVWEGEGTKEIYIEKAQSNSLLLMEPVKDGAYQRAFAKRGAGLHHLAIDVPDLESYIESLAGSGWLLHPRSIRTIKQSQTAYLARPGFPALIEVQEKDEIIRKENFVRRVSVGFDEELVGLLKPIGMSSMIERSLSIKLMLGHIEVLLDDLL